MKHLDPTLLPILISSIADAVSRRAAEIGKVSTHSGNEGKRYVSIFEARDLVNEYTRPLYSQDIYLSDLEDLEKEIIKKVREGGRVAITKKAYAVFVDLYKDGEKTNMHQAFDGERGTLLDAIDRANQEARFLERKINWENVDEARIIIVTTEEDPFINPPLSWEEWTARIVTDPRPYERGK